MEFGEYILFAVLLVIIQVFLASLKMLDMVSYSWKVLLIPAYLAGLILLGVFVIWIVSYYKFRKKWQ